MTGRLGGRSPWSRVAGKDRRGIAKALRPKMPDRGTRLDIKTPKSAQKSALDEGPWWLALRRAERDQSRRPLLK